MGPWIWLALVVIFLILEAVTAGLTTIWFAGGALIAYLSSLVGGGIPVQVFCFVLVSVLLLVFTRPLALKYINNQAPKTGADRLVGRTAVVTEEIDNIRASGRITVDGMPWTARTLTDGIQIPKGTQVTICEISGVKCLVAPAETQE